MLMVGKQISFYFSNFSLRVFNRFVIRDTGYGIRDMPHLKARIRDFK